MRGGDVVIYRILVKIDYGILSKDKLYWFVEFGVISNFFVI